MRDTIVHIVPHACYSWHIWYHLLPAHLCRMWPCILIAFPYWSAVYKVFPACNALSVFSDHKHRCFATCLEQRDHTPKHCQQYKPWFILAQQFGRARCLSHIRFLWSCSIPMQCCCILLSFLLLLHRFTKIFSQSSLGTPQLRASGQSQPTKQPPKAQRFWESQRSWYQLWKRRLKFTKRNM